MNYVQLVAAIDGTAVDDDFQEDVDMDKKKKEQESIKLNELLTNMLKKSSIQKVT